MANIFQELQMLSISAGNEVVKSRKQMNEIVKIFKEREEYLPELEACAVELRHMELQTYIDADAFFIQPDVGSYLIPLELRHESLGFCRDGRLIYAGRLVYPVKDVKGDVMGWCGYDKWEDPKYLDSTNNGYKAKVTTFYGMEKLPEAYESTEPVFFVEGIVCCLFLRQCGFQAFATLGSHLSPYVIRIASRFGHRAVFITDSDESGNKYRKQVRRYLPTARCYQSTIAKDVDDSRQVDMGIVDALKEFKNPFYTGRYFM